MTQQIKRYKTPGGKTRYKFSLSAGQDHATGKSIMIRRQGFKSKQEAQRALSDVLKAIANDEYKPLSERRLTFKEFYEQIFLPQYKKEVRGASYASNVYTIHKRVLPLLGDVYLDKLTVIRCQQAVNQWANELKSFKNVVSRASIVISRAVKMELIRENPFDKVSLPRPKKQEDKPKNFYTKEELAKFLATAEKEESLEYFALVQLLADSGMRKGEALALTWADVDLKQGAVSINKTRSYDAKGKPTIDDTKTAAGRRVIYLLPKTIQVLTDYHEQQVKYFAKGDQDRLFAISAPTVKHLVDRVAKKAGLHRITVHGLRHTAASMLVAAGLSPAQTTIRMGHEKYSTTMDIYTHVSDEGNKAGTEKLAQWLGK
ncbi:tyrosine-type recombinase/integrase [Lactobacillus delbrueckii subsp. bulgaricus]|nr:hypothetical protein [Lactobacillus delbrueckii subsp. bulgaricus]MBT8809654.1 hypothetical protein [Lactobacillus delbrueckii subsp. bulgaricus]MBT8827061.1 hypothetical protein [Lactobacillus delbrueckii subsp. bulgaricus]MBT8842894.1 hypothetical protein [Lactobacillus delbrueckii subsp. bulgaricus]